MLSSPHARLCWIVLNSLESRTLLDLLNNPENMPFWCMLSSPHAGLCWIVLKSLESRPLFDNAKQSTCRLLLDCAK